MIQKIKDALNNSFLWLIFLLSCIAFFWRKEKDAEYELAETKADERIKDDKQQVKEADDASTSAEQHYDDLRRQYLNDHHDS